MALKADPADQALLLELQDLDTRLQRLTNRAATLPEAVRVTELTAQAEALRRGLIDQRGTLDDAQTELRRVEADVAVVDARIARDSERMQSSASVKDIHGLEQELAALAKRKNDLEDIELAVMEAVEQREAEVDGTRDALEALTATQEEATRARDAAVESIARERREAEAARAELAGSIPADLVALYERQRARYGSGASLLRGGVSSASGVALTGSDLSAVRAAAPDDVLLCPDSNAILVRTDESGL